ncbi:C39 family peptidase [Agrobacterium tumefaciens]|uniref:C39 family peptidase n=1 Tax=Agrobacterium tumefaciens TaxID=358 RepID=UPI003CE4BE83
MPPSLEAVPYFSQWETPDMTLSVLAEGSAALLRDPLWRQSGAELIEEYARWAVNVCGMACLKMILAARGDMHPTLALARACTAYGGYVVNDVDASIKGLIYAPFVTYVRQRFRLSAQTVTGVETESIPELLADRPFFIASVNSGIRWPERMPASKGGHLVLVTAASAETIRFHNPSGHDAASQADVTLPLAVFDRFFANRGIAVGL